MTLNIKRLPFRKSFYIWTWLAVVFSVGICCELVWLRYEHSRTMSRSESGD